jgi:KDO2-lipid IV(A) lauroyltransferase
LFATILKKCKNMLSSTNTARKNIKLIYNLPVIEQEKLIDKIYVNFGRFTAEIAAFRFLDIAQIRAKVKINGIENIAHLREAKQPFLICTGHFANWEMALAILNDIYPDSAVVYRGLNNPYVDKMIFEQRTKCGISLIPRGPEGGKILLKALRAKKAIAMLVDQKMNEGISAPLLGHDAMTSDGIARVALNFNYPIVPVQILRINNGSNFHVNVLPPLEIVHQGDKADTIKNIMYDINKILGSWIDQNPDQWMWMQRSWKIKYK